MMVERPDDSVPSSGEENPVDGAGTEGEEGDRKTLNCETGSGVMPRREDLAVSTNAAVDIEVEYDSVSPTEAFAILGHETRIEILRTLWANDDESLTYSELHSAVEVDRGNFNYHLSKLSANYVQRTDEGYTLREAGTQVIRAVLAGTLTTDPVVEPTTLELPCPLCGGVIEFSYTDEFVTVRCTSCEGVLGGDVPRGTFMHHAFPPAGLEDREGIEVLEAARVHYETALVSMLQDVCPNCGGRVDREVHHCGGHDTDDEGLCVECGSVPDVWVDHTCRNCGFSRWCTLWLPTLFHPAVISFVYERRPFESFIELRRLFWLNPEFLADISQTVVSEEPLHVRVEIPFDGEEIALTVDEDLGTVKVE